MFESSEIYAVFSCWVRKFRNLCGV